MFAKWGALAYRRRWVVLIATVVLAVAGGVWGLGVFDRLSQGGYDAPGSEAARATKTVQDTFGRQGGDVIVVYDTADQAKLKEVGDRLADLPDDVVAPAQLVPQPAAGKTLAILTLRDGDSNGQIKQYEQIKDRLAVPGVDHLVGGLVPTQKEINDMSSSDLASAEVVSMPIVLLLLVVIFGGLVAASLPVIVGGLAILGSLGVLHVISLGLEVNSFAVNVASLLGLGMAIDYGLFMVGRFREELAAGRTSADAVRRTVMSAGRTVVFSATLLVIALAGLLLFPHGFLKSLAYGGMSAVAIAAVVSLTLLPALLGVLGHRVDKLSVPWRRKDRQPSERGWRRLAAVVMKRPVLFALPIVAVLVALGAPFLNVKFGEITEKVLPEGNQVRVAAETINRDFAGMTNNGFKVVITGDPTPAEVQAFATRIGEVSGVGEAKPGAEPKNGVWLLNASLDQAPLSEKSKEALREVRALDGPGTEVLVGGSTAVVTDSVDAISDRLPLMAGLLIGATFVLMFLAFGSVLLPIKAVVMSALSLSATFGVLVWVFQEGHGASLLGVTPGPLESGIVVLMAAMVFGLSTDYEVFLLSRMVEARGRGASTEEAVATGLAKTGRVITAAALLLIVVTGAFAFSRIAMMRFVGVGMILALALDATVVRVLLVPAVLKLLGNAVWWAPGPLRRIQERLAIHEEAPVEDEPVPARV